MPTYSIEPRHKQALNRLGKDAIAEGIALLKQFPHKLHFENAGKGVKTVLVRVPDELKTDIYYLEVELSQKHGATVGQCGSIVTRQACEALIEKYGMDDCRKPPGWESVPFRLSQAIDGQNPVKKTLGEASQHSFRIPPIAMERLNVKERSKARKMAALVREAIDSCDWDAAAKLTLPGRSRLPITTCWLPKDYVERLAVHPESVPVLIERALLYLASQTVS